MWPEDEKRCTPCTKVHGNLLRGYAKKFAPREGRSLVFSHLWEGFEKEEQEQARKEEERRLREGGDSVHEQADDGEKEYWRQFEEREAERRAKRKAVEEVRREEERRVIREMLGGMGMREEDQPQARRMGKIAYDGMPGPGKSSFSHCLLTHFIKLFFQLSDADSNTNSTNSYTTSSRPNHRSLKGS